jgi:hypothetical protein
VGILSQRWTWIGSFDFDYPAVGGKDMNLIWYAGNNVARKRGRLPKHIQADVSFLI